MRPRHLLLALILFAPTAALAQQRAAAQAPAITSSLFKELRWRNIGPFRGGRTRSATGHRSQPYTFYFGATNGGVWKTTDAGRTWTPIFDEQPTQSIGAVVVAPSNPRVLYVGTGEGLQRPDLSVGNGVYRSDDAGRTWTHLGLRDAQQIANLAVDPANAQRIFAAALGHPYGPNAERGIFLSNDGGKTFEPVLQKDENTGGNDVDIDPSNPQVVYANLWESRQGPWENAVWQGVGGMFKSVDGGRSWRQLTNGLPAGVNQANMAIAPSNPQRLYATVAYPAANGQGTVGIFRSDDAGESWTQITTDARPAGRIGGGDLPVPIVNPKNADVIIMASTVSWKSTDGGRTWAPFKGAPGGEDYQGGWINPDNPDIVFLVADQGAVVTLNGGESWSAWYNQSTSQLYHIAADNAFPYRLCSGQQESGSVCIASRGNYGAISERDWLPVGVDEYGYVAPDPLDPDIVYGGRSVTRFDRRTGQTSTVGPVAGRAAPQGTYRQVRTMPVVFSEADPHALYFGNNFLWKTTDGGITWQQISPDLTRKTYALPPSIGKYADPSQVQQRGVIYTIGPSYLDPNGVWVGTDDGLIHVTTDGGASWKDVTPPQLGAWWKVFMMEPGRFDAQTAYAAVNTLRLDDMTPHIYRTHDGGATWTEIVSGMTGAGAANAVREDPMRKGLLYASTENGVWVSFDDGDHWHALQQNLPRSSARDIIVKNEDLAVALHGRGFWILDNITALRQLSPVTLQQDALFKPGTGWRVRWNTSTDMPWPKEEPVGENPPDGVYLDYYLKSAATTPVTIEVFTQDGALVRRYLSTDPQPQVPDPSSAPVPLYWYRQPQPMATNAGLHRWVWDLRYQPIATGGGPGRGGLSMGAIAGKGVPGTGTPFVSPGTYQVRLTVNGRSYTQPIIVKQDPRVKTPDAVMKEVYALTDAAYFGAAAAQQGVTQIAAWREQIKTLTPRATGALATALAQFDAKLAELQLGNAATALAGVMNSLQSADVMPTANQRAAFAAAQATADPLLARWHTVRTSELATLNAQLKSAGLPPLD